MELAQAGQGQTPPAASQREDFIDRLNGNTVSIMSGNPNGSYLYFAYDIATALDKGDDLRIIPIVGRGGAQNIKDILFLRGVDMGITQSVVLRYYNETGELGRNLPDRLRYIARLSNEEMHLLVRSDINSVEELKGKKVNFSDVGSGSQIAARLMFKALKVPVQEVNMGQADAFEAMKRGELDATFLVAAKPAGSFARLRPAPEYKLIPIPFTAALQDYFLPATLTSEDYPQLIPPDKPLNTLAASTVLAVFNWPPNSERYRRVARFTEEFFDKFDKLLVRPRHPKWREVNLAAELPGWQRFAPAQEILDREKSSNTELKLHFEQFLSRLPPEDRANITPQKRDALFVRFLEWQATQKKPQ